MYFVAAVLNIISTIMLAKYFAGFGAALSTGITMLITSGIIMNIYYCKIVRLDIFMFWKNIANIFLRLLPIVVLGMATNQVLGQTNSIMLFVIKMAGYSLVYCIAAYIFAMNGEERETVKKLFSKVLKKVKM